MALQDWLKNLLQDNGVNTGVELPKSEQDVLAKNTSSSADADPLTTFLANQPKATDTQEAAPEVPTYANSIAARRQPKDVSASVPALDATPQAPIVPKSDDVNSLKYKDGLSAASLDSSLANARSTERMNNIIKASAGIASAGAGYKGGKADLDTINGNLDAITNEKKGEANDILTKRKAASDELGNIKEQIQTKELVQDDKDLRDPNSDVSKLYRDAFTRMGAKVSDNASAAQIQKAFPPIEKYFNAEENRKSRELTAQLAAQARHDAAKDKQDAKEELQTNNDFIKFNKALESGTASAKSVLGKAANLEFSANRIQTLIDQTKNKPGGATPQQIAELARNLDGMLSGGTGTISGTKELLPKTAQGQFANLEQYILSSPQGANMQDFVKQIEDTVQRERKVAQDQKASIQKRITSGFSHLENKDPSRYSKMLDENGLGANPAQNAAVLSSGPDMVKVMNPEGKKGSIPRDKLEAALKAGYTEVK